MEKHQHDNSLCVTERKTEVKMTKFLEDEPRVDNEIKEA